ncbi:hypothetical protein BP6252_01988 [Coleophoma cylindrospora]|uniref:Uncharacterized protein n=1 Tax=Coleophoma cylindrospora TaxID=1849047 RepID=A0A3D8SF67_9HELO|nr:hypothetical protein BP6252_01988 [Coleophoma cylindrospora]
MPSKLWLLMSIAAASRLFFGTNRKTTLPPTFYKFGFQVISVGGGDPDSLLPKYKGDHEDIAHIAFAWMVDRVSSLLAFDRDALMIALNTRDPGPDSRFGMQDVVRKVHYASSKVKDGAKSFVFKLLGLKNRNPGEFREIMKPQTLLTDLGATNEEVHPSVWFREVGTNVLPGEGEQLTKAYHSRALSDFERIQDTDKGWYWYRSERRLKRCFSADLATLRELKLPEFVIPQKLSSQPSIERALMEDKKLSKKLLRELDAGNGFPVPDEVPESANPVTGA